MIILVLALLGLAIITALILYFSPKGQGADEKDSATPVLDPDCCGAHEQCEQELKKLSADIVYFEDEELDVFAGKTDEVYDNEAIEQFREVLYTLRKSEISEWLHSLDMRSIILPEILKSEVRMLLIE